MLKGIYLVALSKSISEHELTIAVNNAKEAGFDKVSFSRDLILEDHLGYAGNVNQRVEQLRRAFDSDMDVVGTVRGGWGMVHIMGELIHNFSRERVKPLIGYSDVTLLQNFFFQTTGKVMFHGPNMLKEFPEDDDSLHKMNEVLTSHSVIYHFSQTDVFREGYSEGVIIGGNIQLLIRSLGTPFEINTNQKILFLEAVDKPGYLLYDMLYHLQAAGKFSDVQGIVLGQFVGCDSYVDYLDDFFKNYPIPVVKHLIFGHGLPNYTIPIGGFCTIDTKNLFWKIEY